MTKKLNAKQLRFIDEYLIDLNASDAARRAGYSAKTAGEMGYENLNKPHIAAEIARRQKLLQEKAGVTVERVIEEYAKLAFSNMQDFMGVDENGQPYLDLSALTRAQAAAITEVTAETVRLAPEYGDTAKVVKAKVKIADKRGALDSLARHLGMFRDEADQKRDDALTALIAALADQQRPFAAKPNGAHLNGHSSA